MQRLQAFKYELMPNGEQQRQMRRFAGSLLVRDATLRSLVFVINAAQRLTRARCRRLP